MMVEIKGYYTQDRHMINVDAIESVSYASPRHGGSSEHRELSISFKHNNLNIDFLSYIERGQREYDIIIEAMRMNHQQYITRKEEKQDA
jgi:hypothetical protein